LGLLLPTGARAVAARAARAPQIIGGFGTPALDTERFMAGAATIDPYLPPPLRHLPQAQGGIMHEAPLTVPEIDSRDEMAQRPHRACIKG